MGKRIIHLSSSEKSVVYEELTSQIDLCRSFGIPISHADSHNHIHEEPAMLGLLINILKKENIPYIRKARNIGKTSLINRIYRNSYNTILSFNSLSGTNYFGSSLDYYYSKNKMKPNSIIEFMVHPGLIIDNQIFDIYSKENLSIILPEINNNILISYSQIDQEKNGERKTSK